MIGTNELLAACVREQRAIGVCPISFTEMVMRKIRSFGRQPFTVADLYQRLLKDRKRLIRTPQHHSFSNRDGRKLTLQPRQIPRTEGAQSLRIDPLVLSSSTSNSRSSNSLSRAASSSSTNSPSSEYPRILLAISLRSDAVIPDIESCTRWLAVEAPLEILKVDVRVESAYEAYSTLIFVSMPVQVWTYLPKVTAYRFIDFICSDNLLAQAKSELWDEGIPGSVTTRCSVLLEGKYLPAVERQERMDPDTYVKGDPGIVTAQYPQSWDGMPRLDSVQDMYDRCHLDSVRDIRLLSLRPGNPDERIECNLLVRSMTDIISGDNAVPYEVLSYSWYPADPIREILVYTWETTSLTSLRITDELHDALQRLRDLHKHRHFWIDAICINSEDINEKNSHVALMPNIFYHASNVAIFLGADSNDSDLAMDFVVRLINLEDFGRMEYCCTPRELGALNSLMKRQWFCSRWSLQVLALARRATLHCGNAQLDLLDLATAVSLVEAANSDLVSRQYDMFGNSRGVSDFLIMFQLIPAARLLDVMSNLFRKNENWQIQGRCLSLEDLVCQVSSFRSTTPHDIIYSVLALANDAIPMHTDLHKSRLERSVPTNLEEKVFIVDYDKPFLDVCKDFLTHTIRSRQFLDIICRPWVPEDSFKDQEKPSWLVTTKQAAYGLRPDGILDWAHADSLLGPTCLGKKNYSASGRSKVARKWELFGTGARKGFMYVEGFVIDTVGEKTPYAADGIIHTEWLEAGDWSDKSALPPPPFWRTLCADRGPNGSNPPLFYPQACKSALNQTVKGGHISTKRIVHRGENSIVASFLRRVQEVIWMKRLIKTEGGRGENDLPRLGLAPHLTKKRDLICILYGCSVPVVLRKHHAGTPNEHYTFIGECYVHGIMEGEAFDLIKRRTGSESIPKQVFELR